jgi:hypothetical protein
VSAAQLRYTVNNDIPGGLWVLIVMKLLRPAPWGNYGGAGVSHFGLRYV